MAIPFVEIIESVPPDQDLLMWKFPDEDKEIKDGAVLTVRESQSVLFLNEGRVADIFTAGRYTLDTQNIPVLTRLKNWKHGFQSPFKADIFFFNTHQFVNLKWGTPAPVLMRDASFGQVRVRAFGSYNIRITDVAKFFREYAGTFPQLGIRELEWQLRDFIASRFAEALATAHISVVDVAGNLSALNEKIQPLITPYFTGFGLAVTSFTITNATLPEEVLKYYDKATGMNMITDMNKYTQFSMANAMSQENTAMANAAQQAMAMGIILNQAKTSAVEPGPPPEDVTSRLQKLKHLFEAGLINDNEYTVKKEALLKLL
ncbi:MAG: SPFH domain-containing protein [Chitinophaga sp.]|uniref:SPFH domain-containing protein n=1 Tax=Chitinophaga sp. TaxID=1869181 RepID=UPI001B1E8A68|nr:SPFH domain-containing protein [Chitinophaga sp.]MBO9728712.1 SPFH domain-containing protein [Chitinophaga sp.]